MIHDYFPDTYPGIKRAVMEFEQESGMLIKVPIGDKISLAILKPEYQAGYRK